MGQEVADDVRERGSVADLWGRADDRAPPEGTVITSDRVFRFDADVGTVWDAIGRVEDYTRWWPWLRRCEALGLVEGDRWVCTVSPPLPDAMTFTVTLERVEAPRRVDAVVAGDIEGRARLTLRHAGRGSEVRLVSALGPRAGPLVALTRAVPMLAGYGHDWVLDSGYRRFRRRAL